MIRWNETTGRRLLQGMLLAATIAMAPVTLAGTDIAKNIKESDVKNVEAFKKPEWLKEVSIAVKESYNSNIYMSDGGYLGTAAGVPSATGTPRNGTFANNEPFKQSSWITTVTPTVGFEFVSLLGLDKGDKSIESLGFVYSPEIATYHDAAIENYINHKIAFTIKGRPEDDITYGVAETFNYIDGRGDSLFTANGATPTLLSPTSSGTFRERRDQFQNRLKAFVRYELNDQFFIRPVTESLWYDLHTKEINNASYVNFPDRYDANVGFDFGWKANPLTGVSSVKGLSKDYAFFLGYRAGKTYQGVTATGTTPANREHYTSTYQRVLAGVEGQIVKQLKLNFVIGPDFRTYESGFAPTSGAFEPTGTSIFFEGAATYTITPEDSIQGKAKQWQWVASTGRGVYTDRSYELKYIRKISSDLTGNLGYRYVQGDYTSNANDDNLYIISAGLDYKIDDNWSVGTEYSWNQSISDNNSSGGTYAREADGAHVISFGAKWSL